ncbi:MAG: hypothetical protein Q8O40_11335 [Chloroflexota bacterium]|nr:hypothetical protein [Chloroflexota bacterium]
MKAGLGAGRTPTAWYIVPSDNYLARWANTLHLPYTAWHCSYAALGAGMAYYVRWDVLGWAVLAFFLGMGVAAHCFDLLKGDPLALRIPFYHLLLVGAVSLVAAMAIGALNIAWGNVAWWWAFAIAAGWLIALGYNLEWPGMHGDAQFSLFWGAFPALVGYFAMGGGLAETGGIIPGIFAALFATLTAWGQRVLSTRARFLRRKVEVLDGYYSFDAHANGSTGRGRHGIDKQWILEPLDRALMLFSFAMPILAVGVLLWRRGW